MREQHILVIFFTLNFQTKLRLDAATDFRAKFFILSRLSVLISLYNLTIININKEEMKSQYFSRPLMPQDKEDYKNKLTSSRPTQTKLIHKKKKHPLLGHKKKQEDKFVRRLPKDLVLKVNADNEQAQSNTPESWLTVAKEWYLQPEERAYECIETSTQNLPILPSIQQLFSLSSSERLTNEIDIDVFYKYCRTVSFLQSTDGANITLTGETSSGVAQVGNDRQGNQVINSIILTSPEELQAYQKRASFMEKLKENQSKYDTSIGRMSVISKELAFNYRIYLEKRNQLTEVFNLLSAKIPPPSEKPQYAYDQYTRLLIRKNLRQAFIRTEVDPLNYFKFKQYIQFNRTDSYLHILSPEQLKMFIDRRRPKRGRKMQLATACSICLSDYHQMSNPFNACSVCGLRAHKMCFSFENSKCGNCAYQKVERHVKDQIHFCVICKQRGLLAIKLGEKEFAHGFCLLVHGFWKLRGENRNMKDETFFSGAIGQVSSEGFLQSKFRKICNNQIEFLNPNKNCTTVSLPAIDSTIYASNRIDQEDIDSNNGSSLGGIGIMRERQSGWEHRQESIGSFCKICQQAFLGNCFISCQKCQQQYHILCAYLSGFDLKISQNMNNIGVQNLISLNCCCQRQNQVSWSRKYRLNYQRIAFNSEETIKMIVKDPIQNYKDGIFFNI